MVNFYKPATFKIRVKYFFYPNDVNLDPLHPVHELCAYLQHETVKSLPAL